MLGVGGRRQRRLAVDEGGAVVRREQPLVGIDAEAVGPLEARRARRPSTARTARRRRRRRRRAATGRARRRRRRWRRARRWRRRWSCRSWPTTANSPSVPASASAARSAAPVIRPRSSGGTSTTSTSITRAAACTEAWVSPVVAKRHRPPGGSPWRRRAWWRAVTSADRLAADPPLTKQPPAPSGNPARPASHCERLVLGGDGAGAALPQPAEDARRADDEVEQVGGRRRRGRHVGQVQRRVHRPAGVHQHVAEQRQRLVAADALGTDHALERARPAGRPAGRPTSGPSTSSAARRRTR